MAKYGKKAQEKVEKAMHEYKRGELKSGKAEKPVKSKEQAVAIGLSQARKAGAKVPKAPAKKSASSKSKSTSATKSRSKSSTRAKSK